MLKQSLLILHANFTETISQICEKKVNSKKYNNRIYIVGTHWGNSNLYQQHYITIKKG